MRFWVLGLLLVVSQGFAKADTCASFLITTSFGVMGSLIATLNQAGELVYWHDGYVVDPDFAPGSWDLRLTRFSRTTPIATASLRERPLTVSSLPADKPDSGLFSIVTSKGALRLLLPDERTVELLLPKNETAVATTLYRGAPVAEPAATFSEKADRILHPKVNQRSTATAENYTPISLYAATSNRIYRLEIKRVPIDLVSEDFQDTVHGGTTEVEVNEEAEITAYRPAEHRAVRTSRATDGNLVLVPTVDPDTAFRFSQLEVVFETTDPLVLSSINYIHALPDDKIVVASELGQVVVIDALKKQVEHGVSFPGFAWVRSITAHESGGRTEIYAVNAADKSVYRWNSDDVARLFRKLPLPEGVAANQVASFAAPVPVGYGTPLKNDRGYLANFRFRHSGVAAEQIVVLADDGTIYGRVDTQFDPNRVTEPEQTWVAIPPDVPQIARERW